jgi:CspA family cold shock protein
MTTGTVKWYRKSKGYGFITPDDGGEDLFVHFSTIANDKIPVLLKNEHVTFEIKKGPVGPLAVNVHSL